MTDRTTPARSAAAIIASASAAVRAIGFSTTTWRPASAAAIACAAWSGCGVQIVTASTAGIGEQLVQVGGDAGTVIGREPGRPLRSRR